jgi:hypothetical protein
MKTIHYNPSLIEVEFAKIIADLREEIQQRSAEHTITDLKVHTTQDNPTVVLTLKDHDGDKHELILRFIQRVDD